MKTTNEELLTVRTAMRGLNRLLRDLAPHGQLDKLVLTKRGLMVGVVLSVERYEELAALDPHAS